MDLGDERTYLSFLDLVQARVALAFINAGLSAQKVRRAIKQGRKILNSDYPFASARFRTDGKTVVLQVLTPGEDDRLIDLFRDDQYVMKHIVEPSLKGLEFDKDLAVRWWPAGKDDRIVVDPHRQFGQPIDAETGVPTSVLAAAAKAEGSAEKAARIGLVNHVVAPGSERDEALKLAKKITAKSALTVKIGKEAFYRQLEMPLAEAYRYTSEVMVENMLARDAEEGISAFIEKRDPKWEDR